MNSKIVLAITMAIFAGAGSMVPYASAEDGRVTALDTQSNVVTITSAFIGKLMDEAKSHNPGLLAAGFRNKAAAANVESVRTWDDPMFMFGGSVFSARGMDPAMMGDLIYGISQKLPLWGKPGLNRKKALAGMSESQDEAGYQFQLLRRDVTKALISAALAERVMDIESQDLVWLKTTSQALDAKYRAGLADAGDALEIQNEVAENADQLQTDGLESKHDQFALNQLLNRTGESPWPSLQLPSVFPAVPYGAQLLALAFANEPELKILELRVRQERASADLAHRDRLPDVSIGIQGSQFHGDGGFRSGMFTLSFPLPWGNAAKYRSDYEREKANERAAEQDREDQELTVRGQLDELTTDLDAIRRQALLYQDEISVRAREALNDKLASWQAGRATLRDVLDSRRDALNAELTVARAIADQYQTLAELVLWTGQGSFESLLPLTNDPAVNSTKKYQYEK